MTRDLRRPWLLVGLGLIFAGWLLLPAHTAPDEASAIVARASPWQLVASPDGRTLYAACGPRREVAVVDVRQGRVVRTFGPGGTPRGLALSADGRRLAVALGSEDRIVLLDPADGRRISDDPVRDPHGVGFLDGSLLVATGSGIVFQGRAPGDSRTVTSAGPEPFAVAVAPDGKGAVVVSRRATVESPEQLPYAEATVFESGAPLPRHRVRLPSCHLAEAAVYTPDGRYVLIPCIRIRNRLPIVQVARGWVMSSVIAVLDVGTGDVSILPLTEPQEGFADPAGIAVSPDGTRAYVASGGGDFVAVLDLPALLALREAGRPGRPERLSLTREYVLRRVPVGDNPRGVAVFGRGEDLLVAVGERLDDQLVLLGREGRLVGRVPLGPRVPDDALHRGQRAFFDASYCFQSAFSCRSCHPEGHTDGLTYDFEIDGVGEHVVLNRSLLGLAGTSPFKWTGINPSLQRQCGARFAMVLTRADPFPSETLDDMAAWLRSLPPPPPALHVARTDADTISAVERGRALFARSRAKDGRRLRPMERCITCHPPPHFTNRQRTDIGTRGARDPTGAFDVPHLTGVGRKAPYLHDGTARGLEHLWRTDDARRRHGYVADLTDEEMADLLAYLRSL